MTSQKVMIRYRSVEETMNTLVLVLGATTSVAIVGGMANLVRLTRQASRRGA